LESWKPKTGVLHFKDIKAYALLITFQKTEKEFSPTTKIMVDAINGLRYYLAHDKISFEIRKRKKYSTGKYQANCRRIFSVMRGKNC